MATRYVNTDCIKFWKVAEEDLGEGDVTRPLRRTEVSRRVTEHTTEPVVLNSEPRPQTI